MNPDEKPLTDNNQPQAWDGNTTQANPAPSITPTPVPEYPQPDFSQPTMQEEAPVPQPAPTEGVSLTVASTAAEPATQQPQVVGNPQDSVDSPAQVDPVQPPPTAQPLPTDSGQTNQQPLPADAPKPASGTPGVSSKILIIAGLVLIVLVVVAVVVATR